MKRSKLWIQLPGNADNGDNPQAYWMFRESADQWPITLAHVKGIIVRSTALRGGMFSDVKGDDRGTRFLRDVFLPFLKTHSIDLAVNCTSAGRAQCNPGDGPRSELLGKEIEQFQRIRDCGGTIDVFRMQSICSGTIHSGDCMALYPKAGGMERRIEDVVRFIAHVGPMFPAARFIVADTAAAKTDSDHSPQWDYRRMYVELLDGVAAAFPEVDLAFHLAWTREEMAPDLSDVLAAQEFFSGRGVKWGLTPGTDLADLSAADYHAGILSVAIALREAGVVPNDLILTSWKAFPTRLVPEIEPRTFTQTIAEVIGEGAIRRPRF